MSDLRGILRKPVDLLLFLCLFITACQPKQTATVTMTTAPKPVLADSMRVRIRLATTSDWTVLSLVAGVTWQDVTVISADGATATAEFREGKLFLEQPFERAEAGEGVEVLVEALLKPQERGKSGLFRIERGDIGSTSVDFSRLAGGEWVAFKSVSWGEITGDGANAHAFELTASELFGELTAVPATSVPQTAGMPQGTDGYPWWNDSVFYEIFVRSFYDSNGDGIGDINGITQKLDYLNDGDPQTTTDLGVTGIWLMPINPSPSYHGYSVLDYYDVNPEYGTLDDFKNLLAEAHERGIRVIIDLVLNHTSSEHPWFIQAQDPASPYHDWYLWSDTDPGYKGYWGQQVWFPLGDKFYYSVFTAGMPDLNYTNPAVTAEMQNVVRFWLEDIGIDGFRLDAAKHIIEEGKVTAHAPSTHTWYESFRPFYKAINPQAITVGEIWDKLDLTLEYVQGDELDIAFEFYLADAFVKAAREGDAGLAGSQLWLAYKIYPPLQFAPFLTNHDQNRIFSELGGNEQAAKVAASMMLTSPGMPFLYYGEEIGMRGQKPDEQIRTPMQWDAGEFAGFSSVAPWEAQGYNWQSFNVADETGDPDSLLSHYRALIQARTQHAALRVGDLAVLTTGNKSLYGILRVSKEEAVLVLVNVSAAPIKDYSLNVDKSSLAEGRYQPSAIMVEGDYKKLTVKSGGGFSGYKPLPEIPPYATIILQLK